MELVCRTGAADEARIFPNIPDEYNNVHFNAEVVMYHLTGRVLMVWVDVDDSDAPGLRLMEELPEENGSEVNRVMITNIPVEEDHLGRTFNINAITLDKVIPGIVLLSLTQALGEA